MNKILLALAILVAIALLALPPALGGMTETRVRERVEAIEKGGYVAAKVEAYERGWFRSKAKISFTFAPQYAAQLRGVGALADDPTGALPSAVIVVDFAHGPVAVLDGVHFGWSKMIARPDPDDANVVALQERLGVPYLFEFRGRTGFAGGVSFDADIPSMDVNVETMQGQLKFSGAFLAGTFKNRALEADTQIDSVELASPFGGVIVHDVRASVDNELKSQTLAPGKASFTVGSVSAFDATAGQPVFEASNLRVMSDVALKNDGALADVTVTYGLENLRAQDNEFSAANLGVAARNLDVEALEAYAAAAREAAASGQTDDPAALLAALGPQMERALAAGPSLTLEPIAFRWDGEPFEGRIEVTTNTQRLPPAGALSFDNPLLLLGIVNSNADLKVSKVLAQRLAVMAAQMQLASNDSVPPEQVEYMAQAQGGLMLTALAGQGVLVDDGDSYRTAVRFADGALTLNGNPLPFGL
jgi:uncharacterized protein YdgA (DUF945 family)